MSSLLIRKTQYSGSGSNVSVELLSARAKAADRLVNLIHWT